MFPNPLLRTFIEKVAEKSFDKGLFWGIFVGVMVTHFYKEDHYKKLQGNYYRLKEDFIHEKYFKNHECCGARQDGGDELR